MDRILNIEDIQKIIPQREPFMFVDRAVLSDNPNKITGYKNITMNEWYFPGHFPGHPIMPGALIVEALGQLFSILLLSKSGYENKLAMVIGVDNFKFRKSVVPGDIIEMRVELLKEGGRAGRVEGCALVDKNVAAHGDFSYVVVNK